MIKKSRVFSDSFLSSSSFVNNKEKHPSIFSLINWNNVVLSKEELVDDKWLYIGVEDKKIIENQLHVLKFYNDNFVIIRE